MTFQSFPESCALFNFCRKLKIFRAFWQTNFGKNIIGDLSEIIIEKNNLSRKEEGKGF